jgi:siroheme synthase (precorrin-2 oxidase/ferrochelatase)
LLSVFSRGAVPSLKVKSSVIWPSLVERDDMQIAFSTPFDSCAIGSLIRRSRQS